MVRGDIVASMRNALERGYSVQQAKQSLINAGYSLRDIDEATNYLTGGLTPMEIQQMEESPEIQETYQEPNENQYQAPQINQIPKKKKRVSGSIILLFIIILILVSMLVTGIIFWEDIIDYMNSLF